MKLTISQSSNTPHFYTEGEMPKEELVSPISLVEPITTSLLPSRYALGARVKYKLGGFGNDDIPSTVVDNCIICGIHFYMSKVAYDLYIPVGIQEPEGQHYTLATNVDSNNVVDMPNWKSNFIPVSINVPKSFSQKS